MPVYHVWFATKSRRWLLQGEVVEAAHETLRQIASEKQIGLLEVQAIVDHVHLLLECESKDDLAWSMNLLKGISARRLGIQFPDYR
jgi:putative transposase